MVGYLYWRQAPDTGERAGAMVVVLKNKMGQRPHWPDAATEFCAPRGLSSSRNNPEHSGIGPDIDRVFLLLNVQV